MVKTKNSIQHWFVYKHHHHMVISKSSKFSSKKSPRTERHRFVYLEPKISPRISKKTKRSLKFAAFDVTAGARVQQMLLRTARLSARDDLRLPEPL
jgi:hypothetical protein